MWFWFEHERKARKIDNLTEKSGFLVRFLIFSRFLLALCIINYVYPYCCSVRVKLLIKFFFLGILFVLSLLRRISFEDAVCFTKCVTCLVTLVLTRVTVYLLWELGWECHLFRFMRVSWLLTTVWKIDPCGNSRFIEWRCSRSWISFGAGSGNQLKHRP